MNLGRTAQRFGAALLVVAFVLAGTTPGYLRFRCAFELAARTACCCPAPGKESPGTLPSALAKRCCCEVETLLLSGTPQEAPPVHPLKASLVPLAVTQAPLDEPRPAPWPGPPAGDAHHGTGPPILLLKHCLLL